jgi:GNAT superfamily N-acetyltransferase
MSRLIYRPATAADLPFIVGLIVEDNVVPTGDDPTGTDPVYVSAVAEITESPNDELCVAKSGGKPVGCFQLSFTPGLMRRGAWRATIEAVHIVAGRRSDGLGSEMIGFAVDRSRQRGCGMVQLTSNKKRVDAHRFYERLGFAKSHEGFKLYL